MLEPISRVANHYTVLVYGVGPSTSLGVGMEGFSQVKWVGSCSAKMDGALYWQASSTAALVAIAACSTVTNHPSVPTREAF